MDIVSTNHHLLVDQNITASHMMPSHQNPGTVNSVDRKGRDGVGRAAAPMSAQAIHVNDQSMEREKNGYEQTRTDDLAASSPTLDEL